MFFIQNGHQLRFVQAVTAAEKFNPSTGIINREYGPAFYLLTATPEIWRRCEKYTGTEIDFPAILERDRFSSGERVIVRLASTLFNAWGESGFSIGDMITELDDEKYRLCLEALRIRRSNEFLMERPVENA